MKKLLTLIALLAINLTLFAQAPQQLSYQAVIRNSSGGLVVSHAVGMRISILQGSASGTAVYVETHTTTTNANGLATVQIGGGTVVSGTFATINWASGTYYLKTEADPAGGTSYTIGGTSQLLSVPYALNSKTSESVTDNSVTSAKIAGGAVTGAKIAQAGATSGQALKWNGTTWAPGNDETGGGGIILPFSGSASTDGATLQIINSFPNYVPYENQLIGIKGSSMSSYGTGVYGEALSDGGASIGVYGKVHSANGTGVYGLNDYLLGSGRGVKGESASTEGRGVYGLASATTGRNYGVYGESKSENEGYGVYGIANVMGNGGSGVYGEGANGSGIYGKVKFEGYGVYGLGESDAASNWGVFGQSNSKYGGIGVEGKAEATTGVTIGVMGSARSSSGYGVYGKASSATGTNYGVYGETASADGYAGYFKGRFYTTGSTTGNTDLFYVTNTGTGRAIHAVAAGNTAVWGASTSGYAGVDGRNTSGIGVSGHSDTNYGVYGKSNDSYGVFGTSGLTGGRFEGVSTGVYGISTGTAGINFGVYGKTNSAAGYAGYFEGNVKVTGTLSKGGGSFEIDHPLEPANKILRHSFVESPDMMNVYNGNIRTDANGIAEVILPDYFEALNRDFRYQLTVMGEFAQAIIGEKISDNRFTIRTDKPDVEVSWQVTGIRKDPWAAVNRILVEEKKSQTLQGHYLYPELYGNSVNPSIIRIEERGKKKMAKDQDIINGS